MRQPPVSEGVPHIKPTLKFRFVLVTEQPAGQFLGKFVTTDYLVSLTPGTVSYFKDSRGTFFKLEPL